MQGSVEIAKEDCEISSGGDAKRHLESAADEVSAERCKKWRFPCEHRCV